MGDIQTRKRRNMGSSQL